MPNPIAQYLIAEGWERTYYDDTLFHSGDGEHAVEVTDNDWELQRFTDADVYIPDFGLVAKGRYVSTGIEGEGLAQLQELLATVAQNGWKRTVEEW